MDNVEFKDLKQENYVKNVPVSNNQIKTRALSFKSIKSHWHNFVSNLALTKKVEKAKEVVNNVVADVDKKAKEFFDRFELKNCFFLSLDDRNLQMALVGAHPIKLKKTMQDGIHSNLPFIKKYLGNKANENVEASLNNEEPQINRGDIDSAINGAFENVSTEENKKLDVVNENLNREEIADVIDNAFDNKKVEWAPPALEEEQNLEIPDFNLLADGEKPVYDGLNVPNFANGVNTSIEVPQEEVVEEPKVEEVKVEETKEDKVEEVPVETPVEAPVEEEKEPELEVASFANNANEEYNSNKEVEVPQEEVVEEPKVEEVPVETPVEVPVEEEKEPELEVASFANKANEEYNSNKEVEVPQEEVVEEPKVEEVPVETPVEVPVEEEKEPNLEVASFANKANDEYNLNKEVEVPQEEVVEEPKVEEVPVETPVEAPVEEEKEPELEVASFANNANREYNERMVEETKVQEEKEEEVSVEAPVEEEKEPELEVATFANNANREYRERMAKEAEVQDEEPLFTIVNEEEKPEEINDYSFTAEVDKAFSVEKLEELKKSILETKKNNEEAKNKAQLAAEKKKESASKAEAIKKAKAEKEERLAVMFNKLNDYYEALKEDTEREERKANEDLDAAKSYDADIMSDESAIKDYDSQIDEINSLIGSSAENVQVRR